MNHLLWNNIPVKWIIKTGKNHNDPDFSAFVWQIFPQNTTLQDPEYVTFAGGPFVVPVRWSEVAIVCLLFSSIFVDNFLFQPIIKEFVYAPPPRGPVQVFKLAETVEVDVRYFLVRRWTTQAGY